MGDFIESILKVNSFILAVFGVSIVGAVLKYLKWKKINIDKTNNRLKLLEEAQLALLHNKIYTTTMQYIQNDYVTLDDLEDLRYLYEPYKELGGNGTAERLYTEVQCLKKLDRNINNKEK